MSPPSLQREGAFDNMILYYLLIAIAPFENPPIIGRLLGNTGSFKILGGLCVIYAIFDLGRHGCLPAYFRTWQARFFVALVVLASVSFFSRGLAPFFPGSLLLVYVDFVVFFFVTVALVRSQKRLTWMLFSMAAGMAYGSVDIIRDWRHSGFNLYYRAGNNVTDGDYFSTSAALILPFVFLMIFHSRKRWEKIFYSGCLLISLPAVIFTGSRGGFIAVAVSFCYLIGHLRHRVRNFILLSVLSVPFLIWLPMSPVQRFLHPRGTDTEQTRLWAWEAGLKMFKTHPLFGVGLGNFKPLMPLYVSAGANYASLAHNTYIEYLAELGPAGLVLFTAIIVCTFRSFRRVRNRTRSLGSPSRLYLSALSLEAGMLGFLSGAFFLSAEYQKLLWAVVFLSIRLPGLVRPVGRMEDRTWIVERSPAPAGVGEEA